MKPQPQVEAKNLDSAAVKRSNEALGEISARVRELRKQIDALNGQPGVDAAHLQRVKDAAETLADELPGDGIHGPTGHVNPGPQGVPNPEPPGVQRKS